MEGTYTPHLSFKEVLQINYSDSDSDSEHKKSIGKRWHPSVIYTNDTIRLYRGSSVYSNEAYDPQ